ncbi:bifunctional (p)ppGpp synthetase/guanosine-3',5'-bis(diphosphate) 3'-pyrophosphohydrolase, partial [bacterium]|nr:bifunctional (p)ppGpp synthetase/guanosine-3',5'-bis(diphosphate) 3'-pyrophosphohydrolase [bacterium]
GALEIQRKGSLKADNASDIQFSWMRKLVEYDEDVTSSKDFVDRVKLDLFSDQVFVFTPNGDVFDLPQNATPVDFAYRIHSDVGHKTVGALVNGRIAQLDSKLKNGDIVEIMTSKHPAPRLDWLNFVVTKQASSKIKQWFKKNNREEHINLGKSNLEKELTKTVFEEHLKSGEFERIAKLMNYISVEDLFAALGYGETTTNKVIHKIKKPKKALNESFVQTKNKKKSEKDIIGLEGLLYSLAKCCSPIPGEPIVGVVTRSKGVSVHRADCHCLEGIPPERYMEIHWANEYAENKTYTTTIKIETADKMGLLKDIIAAVSDNNTNIISANVKSKEGEFGIIELGLEIDNIWTLRKVISSLQSMPDVHSVKRTQSSYIPKPNNKSKNKKPAKKV